jgi:hypothetical protein
VTLPNDDAVAAVGTDHAASIMALMLTILRRRRCGDGCTEAQATSETRLDIQMRVPKQKGPP